MFPYTKYNKSMAAINFLYRSQRNKSNEGRDYCIQVKHPDYFSYIEKEKGEDTQEFLPILLCYQF
jgi:hypothetical protein